MLTTKYLPKNSTIGREPLSWEDQLNNESYQRNSNNMDLSHVQKEMQTELELGKTMTNLERIRNL